jgi:branched-chain amino acid transport system ATP-binding protein
MATAEATSMLDVQSLSAGYLGTPVVRDLSLRVDAGEVVALFGPNGAGKTTTLSAIAGLIEPLDGSIRFGDEDTTGRPAHRLARAGVSLVPEGRALFFGLTVREHLKLAGRSGDSLPSCRCASVARPACCPAASSRCSPSAGRW